MVVAPIAHIGERIYVGVDVSKASHFAGIVSATLLERHRRFELCPTFKFENSRQGFLLFIDKVSAYTDPGHISVVLETTGHYHRPLEEFLQDRGVTVYCVHPQEHVTTRAKSDKIDALRLANQLYSQVQLGAQFIDASAKARLVAAPSEAARQLRGLVRHHYELSREMSRRKNKLIAICDELFPEFTEAIKDANGPTALRIRERFPTPAELASASEAAVIACRPSRGLPGKATLLRLQALAKNSVGIKDPGRTHSLVFEQSQLICELRLLEQNLAQLDTEIARIVNSSREGKILTSLPMVDANSAAVIISHIGSISNFENAARLRTFFGWSPKLAQTGVSRNSSTLTRGGSRVLKKTLYLMAWCAISHDTEWKELYDWLVPRKCAWDSRKEEYVGRNKVVGSICGRIASVIFALLKKDHDLLASLEPGATPPEPQLYDREYHRRRRAARRPTT